MSLSPFDWFLAFILIVGLALWARRERQRVQHGLSIGRTSVRMAGYRRLIFTQWSLVGMLGLHWALRARPASDLGLTLGTGWRPAVGLLLAMAGTILLWLQLRSVQQSEENRASAREALAGLQWLLPHSRRELNSFMRVSLTAGICEELLYRGFLAWFLATWMPLWAALLVSGVLFGLAHLYQGVTGVLKTGLIGIVFGGITLLTGSIIWAMILHTAVDAINGQLAYVALTTPAPHPDVTLDPPEPNPDVTFDHAKDSPTPDHPA